MNDVTDKQLEWKFVEDQTDEPAGVATARENAHEAGIESVSPAVGAQLAVLAAALNAQSMIEIGTGCGVSGLWLLSGAPEAHLTSIDLETEHQNSARATFADAGIPAARVRLIQGDAGEVLPRMNESSYDLVLIDADRRPVIDYFAHALRIVRPGGIVAIAGALQHGRVADPAKRDDVTADYRAIVAEVSQSASVAAALSIVGDGLLQVVTARAS